MQLLRQAGRFLSLLWKPIERNAAFFTFMFVLGFMCTQLEVSLAIRNAVPYEHAGPELYFDLYLLCAVLALLPLRWRRGVRAVLYVLFYGMALVDMYCYVRLNSMFTPTMLLIIGETNGGEAAEFLRTYLSWDLIGSYVGWALLVLVAHVSWTLVFIGRRSKVEGQRSKVRSTKGRKKEQPSTFDLPSLRPVLGAWAGALLIYGFLQCYDNKVALKRMFSYSNVGDVEREVASKQAAEMYLPVYRLAFSIYANRLIARQIDVLRVSMDEARVDSCSLRSRQIVLVIGESYNRQHSQLYGYEKPTTPRQMDWQRRGNLVRFDDVVAPWNLTSYMFKHLFSMYSVGDDGDWCDQPLFPKLFRLAGYQVNFLTNQFLPQAGEAVYDFSGGFFLNDPELSRQMFTHRNTRLHRYDEGMLQELDALHADSASQPVLTIVHLKGQHTEYRARYPKDTHSRFFHQDYAHRHLSVRDKMVTADYDNATLYNDSILDGIVRRYEHQDAIVIYVPDHGDECFGDDLHICGRMHTDHLTPRLAREEYLIPFWVWCSDEYVRCHPDVAEAVRQAAGRKYMSDRLPHMLLWLAGISAPYYRPRLNVLSPDYDEQTPRVLRGKWDYDKQQDI